MAPVLHVGATVVCAHGGVLIPMAPSGSVRVGGRLAVTLRRPHAVHGCPHRATDGTPSPCAVASWLTGSHRVRVNGQPLLLADSTATCTPNATGVRVLELQGRVRAD